MLLPGTEVGPFRILGLLGKGGMAAVYRAEDARLERTVALKVLPPEFLFDGAFARRFEQEARVIAKLEHQSIVPIYASGIDGGIPWMSMRLLAGGNLGTLLEHGRPDARQAVRMLRDIADALDYAHARGVVHRDIKPTNILLDGAGGLCIGDFGLAQLLEGDRGVTRTGTLIGTPHYMAPEQALGERADHLCDIYSLGIVAYEMFVGTVPFNAESPVAVLLKHVNQPLPVPPDGLLSKALAHAIQKAVAKTPAERWPTAGAFAEALEVATGGTPQTSGRQEGGRANRHLRGSRLGWTSAAAIAVSAATGVTWWWIAREPPVRVQPPSPIAIEQSSAPSAATSVPAAPSIDERPRLESAAAARVRSGPTSSPPAPSNPAVQGEVVAASEPPPLSSPAEVPTPSSASVVQIVPAPISPLTTTDRAPRDVPRSAVADVLTQPIRIRTVSPSYPPAARAAQLEGDVVLEARVGVDGGVRDVTVLRSVHPLIDEAAKNAVLQYRYTPGQRNAVPEAVTVRITVSFRLR